MGTKPPTANMKTISPNLNLTVLESETTKETMCV